MTSFVPFFAPSYGGERGGCFASYGFCFSRSFLLLCSFALQQEASYGAQVGFTNKFLFLAS